MYTNHGLVISTYLALFYIRFSICALWRILFTHALSVTLHELPQWFLTQFHKYLYNFHKYSIDCDKSSIIIIIFLLISLLKSSFWSNLYFKTWQEKLNIKFSPCVHLGCLPPSWDFPGNAVVKNPPARAGVSGDKGWIPRWERSLGGGSGNPLQYSCLEKSRGQRSLAGYSPWDCKEPLNCLSTSVLLLKCSVHLHYTVNRTSQNGSACLTLKIDFYPFFWKE